MTDFSFALMEMYDLRNILPAHIKATKANDEDTDYTVGDLIDGVIERLEAYEAPEAENLYIEIDNISHINEGGLNP